MLEEPLIKNVLYSTEITEKHLKSYLFVYKFFKTRSRSSSLVDRLQINWSKDQALEQGLGLLDLITHNLFSFLLLSFKHK